MIRSVVAMAIVGLAATPASGYPVGPAVPVEALAKTADLVCKATVVSERPVTDAWFAPVLGFEVREADLKVISIIKGSAQTKQVRFRHYAPKPGPVGPYAPQSYQLAIGRTFLVFAMNGAAGEYRQLAKAHTAKADQGVMLAADARPHRGKSITDASWAELRALLASASPDDVVGAITQLDEMSGGHRTGLKDFDRRAALEAIRPLIESKLPAIATAAIAVFGADSPYFDERQAAFWLAGIGKGTIPGLEPLEPSAHPTGGAAIKELGAVADAGATVELRALAIRALGRSNTPARIATWARDRELAIRRAAVLASSALADRSPITAGAKDPAPEVRIAAALAIGFAQDPALLPVLGTLVADAAPKVASAAALSLLSFSPDRSGSIMKASLGSDFRSLFVNALARRDPQPYLAILAEVIEQQLRPNEWWGGMIPAGDSWTILFGYVKARPPAELIAGNHDRSLDALERMRWFSSSEPRDLYALYVVRGMTARAQRFRAAARKANTGLNLDYYFDMADKSPATYVP